MPLVRWSDPPEASFEASSGLAALPRPHEAAIGVAPLAGGGSLRHPGAHAEAADTTVCSVCASHDLPAVKAAAAGHVACLAALKAAGRVQGVADKAGATAVHNAASNGHLDCLRTLLVGAKVSALSIRDNNGSTPGHYAAYHGQLQCLRWICRKSKGTAARATAADGCTPVHYAAATGHLSCLQFLCSESGGGRKDDVDGNGATPLYLAAQEGHAACVEWLVREAGADPTARAIDGMCAVHAAAQAGKTACLRAMFHRRTVDVGQLRDCEGATPVHLAAGKGQVQALECLLREGGATGNEQDNIGATPVHDAAEQGKLASLRLLANAQANLDQRDDDKLTPLQLARHNGHQSCATFLEGQLYNAPAPGLVPRAEDSAGEEPIRVSRPPALDHSRAQPASAHPVDVSPTKQVLRTPAHLEQPPQASHRPLSRSLQRHLQRQQDGSRQHQHQQPPPTTGGLRQPGEGSHISDSNRAGVAGAEDNAGFPEAPARRQQDAASKPTRLAVPSADPLNAAAEPPPFSHDGLPGPRRPERWSQPAASNSHPLPEPQHLYHPPTAPFEERFSFEPKEGAEPQRSPLGDLFDSNRAASPPQRTSPVLEPTVDPDWRRNTTAPTKRIWRLNMFSSRKHSPPNGRSKSAHDRKTRVTTGESGILLHVDTIFPSRSRHGSGR